MKYTLKSHDVDKLKYVQNLINSDFKSRFTIQELAQKAGTNEYTLKHGFKKVFGVTIHDYRLNLRIENVKALLLESDAQIKTIAMRSGFRNIASFNRAFKRVMGEPPLQWRKKNER